MGTKLALTAAFLIAATGLAAYGANASVTRTGNDKSPIAESVTVTAGSDTVYLSGQVGVPFGAPAAGAAPVEPGDTNAQATKALDKIKAVLASQNMTMGDIVMMHAWLAGDPAKGGKADFAGWNAAYSKYFGTKDQPNKPSRTSLQVAALAVPAALIEVEVIAAHSKR